MKGLVFLFFFCLFFFCCCCFFFFFFVFFVCFFSVFPHRTFVLDICWDDLNKYPEHMFLLSIKYNILA